jgi:hypothetical protein
VDGLGRSEEGMVYFEGRKGSEFGVFWLMGWMDARNSGCCKSMGEGMSTSFLIIFGTCKIEWSDLERKLE